MILKLYTDWQKHFAPKVWPLYVLLVGFILLLLAMLCGCASAHASRITHHATAFEAEESLDLPTPQFISGDLQSSSPAIGVVTTPEKPVVIIPDGLGNTVGRYWNREPEVYGTSVLLLPGTDAGSHMMYTRKLWPSVESPQTEEAQP